MNTTMDPLIQNNTLRRNMKLPLSQNTVLHQIMYEYNHGPSYPEQHSSSEYETPTKPEY